MNACQAEHLWAKVQWSVEVQEQDASACVGTGGGGVWWPSWGVIKQPKPKGYTCLNVLHDEP